MIIVSKCLIGYNCKYNGKNNYCEYLVEYLKDKSYIAVCAEELGGLTTPRFPSEIKGEEVYNQLSVDVTKQFKDGANLATQIVSDYPIDMAILKAKSPSCGNQMIYDGSFQGRLIPGSGLFAKQLEKLGIPIMNEIELKAKIEKGS